ncbi:nucleolin [Hordeum vulgare]|nr:nucleolin [Hordeum vulgare]
MLASCPAALSPFPRSGHPPARSPRPELPRPGAATSCARASAEPRLAPVSLACRRSSTPWPPCSPPMPRAEASAGRLPWKQFLRRPWTPVAGAPPAVLASPRRQQLTASLLTGIPTTNTIMRHTLMPKSGDDKMIRGHSINLLHLLDTHTRFRVMDLIVETIWRTTADHKRSCGYAPYIHMLINAKLGKHVYLLDRPHLPLQPEFEDNEVVMDDNDPNSAAARMAAEAARNRPPPVSQLRTQAEKMAFLVSSVQGM